MPSNEIEQSDFYARLSALSKLELYGLETKYDWVLNARRKLLDVKLDKPLEELKELIEKVRQQESDAREDSQAEPKT